MSKHQTRVSAYLDRRERARGIDTEHIHDFDGGGDDPGFLLLQSDLRALLADLERAEKALKAGKTIAALGDYYNSFSPDAPEAVEIAAPDGQIDAAMAQMAGGGEMVRELKLWNGRGYCCIKPGDPLWQGRKFNQSPHAYVAAYSRADAARVIAEYCGKRPPDNELRDYFSECWGNPMNGVVPVRGLWLSFESVAMERPIQVHPTTDKEPHP